MGGGVVEWWSEGGGGATMTMSKLIRRNHIKTSRRSKADKQQGLQCGAEALVWRSFRLG